MDREYGHTVFSAEDKLKNGEDTDVTISNNSPKR